MSARPRWTMERGTLWVKELDGPANVPRVTSRLPALFDELPPESADELAAAMDVTDVEAIRRRFSIGRRCFAARVGGKIAAYGWVSRDREGVGEMEREIHLAAGEVYVWDCATLPVYRQQGLYSALLSAIIGKMQSEGIRRVWIGTARANQPSMQGFANAGFQWAIYITYLRILNVRLLWMNGSGVVSDSVNQAARQIFTGDQEHTFGNLVIGV